MPKTLTFLDYQEWIAQFNPVMLDGAPKLFLDTSPWSAVGLAPSSNVWSLMNEGDDWFIVNGARSVNRMGFYITANEWDATVDYLVDVYA
jgi:hypothetical protein